jgi:hypothetical protein
LSLGNSGGGNLDNAATSSAYIVFFAANEPAGGSGGLAGDIYAGRLELGQNTTGGTITTRDTNEALTIDTNGTGSISVSTGTTGKTISIGTNASAANTIAIGSSNASATLALTGGDDWSVSTAGLAVLGATSNSFTFNPGTGPVYVGTARPTKRITLTAEYAGATLTADGSNNNLTLTADNMTTSPYRNYYKWTNTQGTAQDYDIWVTVPLPADFSAMAATPTLSIDTYSSDLTNGTVLVTVYDTNNSARCTDQAFTPTGSTNTWESITSTACLDAGGTYAANGVIKIKIHMTAAATTGDTRVSTIYFDYLAKF